VRGHRRHRFGPALLAAILIVSMAAAPTPASARPTRPAGISPVIPPIGALLQTQVVPSGTATSSIELQGAAVGAPVTTAAGAHAYQLAIFDRVTLAPYGTPVIGSDASVSKLQSTLTAANTADAGDGLIAIFTAPSGSSPAPLPLLEQLGVGNQAFYTGQPFMNLTVAYSIVAIFGKTGQNTQTWRSAGNATPGAQHLGGNLTGYLQLANGGVGPYTFVPFNFPTLYTVSPTRTPQNVSKTTNTVQVCRAVGASCTATHSTAITTCAAPSTPGGFQVVVLRAVSLAVAANQTFTTNDGCYSASQDVQADLNAMTAMSSFLATYADNSWGTKDKIIVVQSIGTPRPLGTFEILTSPQWAGIGAQIAGLGGTASAFGEIGSPADGHGSYVDQGYSLVGFNDLLLPGSDIHIAPEVSLDNPGLQDTAAVKHMARITAVLTRNHRYGFIPQVSSTADTASAGGNLGALLYRAPTPWPHTQSAGGQAALAALTTLAAHFDQAPYDAAPITISVQNDGNCYQPNNVRSAFCDKAFYENTSTYRAAFLTAANNYPGTGHGYTLTQWQKVANELALEASYVGQVQTFIAGLQAPFTSSSDPVDIAGTVTNVIQNTLAAPPPPNTSIASVFATWLSILSSIFGGAAEFVADTAQTVLYEVSAGVSIAGALVSSASSGEPGEDLAATVQSTAGNLAADAAQRYAAAVQEIGYFQQILVTDPGKLVLAAGLANGTNAQANAVADALTKSTHDWAVSLLMKTVFTNYSMYSESADSTDWPPPQYTGQASQFMCGYEPLGSAYIHDYQPWADLPAWDSYTVGGAPSFVLVAGGNPGLVNDQFPTKAFFATAYPAQDTMTNLFTASTGIGDLTNTGLDPGQFFEQGNQAANCQY